MNQKCTFLQRVSAKINLAVDKHGPASGRMINDILGILHDGYVILSPHIGITSCTTHTPLPAGLLALYSVFVTAILVAMIRICRYI